MRYRYTGPDASRDLAIPGGFIEFPRMKWVDPVRAAEEMNVDPRHLEVVLAGLGEDWEAEGPKKAAATRRRNRQAAAQADQSGTDDDEDAGDGDPETPAEPDEESA